VGDSSHLLQKLELLVLETEERYTKVCKLLVERGIPVPQASSLCLDFEKEKASCLVDNVLLQKLDALVVSKENECTKVRKRLAEARKRGMSRTQDGVSTLTNSKAAKPILLEEPSSKSSKQVTWGALSARRRRDAHRHLKRDFR
jgi:hypothetical protein